MEKKNDDGAPLTADQLKAAVLQLVNASLASGLHPGQVYLALNTAALDVYLQVREQSRPRIVKPDGGFRG